MFNNTKRGILATMVAFWSTLEESDDEEQVIVHLLHSYHKTQTCKRVCIRNYVDVVETYSLSDFQRHFRLTKSTVETLLMTVEGKLKCTEIQRGRPSHDAKRQLLITLWMLANEECYRSIADRFDVSISTAWAYFRNTVDAINIVTEFHDRCGFPGVLGAIDGTHIPIATPTYMQNSYINRNKYHSIVLQGVCTARYKFIDCYTGM
ncbi:hypothetical protein RI129_003084 [Pyrocoelia pectoralis]|uniref:DDE Tnp4 domain-containing protein n=1 Tax=Pyrocoelia pectoralis TaxID=417401 RepID=A0AAN7VHJ2_9COLE